MDLKAYNQNRCLWNGLYCYRSLIIFGLLSGGLVSFAAFAAFQQETGLPYLISIEAEHYHHHVARGGYSWIAVSKSGQSGEGAMQAMPDNGANINDNYALNSPRLDFDVEFVTTGTHYLWVRGIGSKLANDSVHVGFNGNEIPTGKTLEQFASQWTWSNDRRDPDNPGEYLPATIEVETTGIHTINVWMREDGFIFDKLVVTTDPNYIPTGAGPAESTYGEKSTFSLPSLDNFNNNSAQNWSVVDEAGNPSNWRAVHGKYHQQNQIRLGRSNFDKTYHIGTYTYLNTGFDLQNYRFSVEMTPLGDSGDNIGIMFCYQDRDNYYRLTLDSRYGFTRLEKKVAGRFYPLATNSRGYNKGQPLNVTIEAAGATILVYLNGDSLFGITDSSLSSGTVALYSITQASFDNVLIERNSTVPAVIISTSLAHSIETTGKLVVSAVATPVPAGGKVKFVLDGTTSRSATAPPYRVQFSDVSRGEHTIRAILQDSSNKQLASDTNRTIGARGQYYVGVGDSITNGTGDNYQSDNTSQDGRIIGIQGYEARLNDLLTATHSYPHLIFNEGVGGDKSQDTALDRIDSILARHLPSNKALVLLGANDAVSSLPVPSGLGCSPGDACYEGSFKQNMQQILNKIAASRKTAIVGLTPPRFGSGSTGRVYTNPVTTAPNRLIQDYGKVVLNELTGRDVGPNFFKCFLEEANLFSLFADNVHPNALGYSVMAQLWHDALIGVIRPQDPCPAPRFILKNLVPSTVAPFLKQNLLEIGDAYYVDEGFTLTSIPDGLGLEDGIWIMTANADRTKTGNTYISFNVDRNATVYVAYDHDPSDPNQALPAWLSNFTDTGQQLGVSQSGVKMRLYKANYPKGKIVLGGNLASGAAGAKANYLAIVVQR